MCMCVYVCVCVCVCVHVCVYTDLTEIGREQFCARYHKDTLRDIAYCPSRRNIATCGNQFVKIIDMKDWKVK